MAAGSLAPTERPTLRQSDQRIPAGLVTTEAERPCEKI